MNQGLAPWLCYVGKPLGAYDDFGRSSAAQSIYMVTLHLLHTAYGRRDRSDLSLWCI